MHFRFEVKIHWNALPKQSVFLCGCCKVVSEQRSLFFLNDWVGPWDLWCWRLAARMPFIYSNDKKHSFFKNPSMRYLANNGLKMKENEISKWQIKGGLLLMFMPWGDHYLVPFFFFTWHQRLPYGKKKSLKRLLTGGKWVFYFPRLKEPQIITARSALWVIEPVSGCDKCFSFWTCQKKMNLCCTTGHLGCWVSTLYLNIPQDFHQCGTIAEHQLQICCKCLQQ